VVLAPSGVRPETLPEGQSSIPWFGEVYLYDLRQQVLTIRFTALTSDGGTVSASASVVTYRIVPQELLALAREVGPDYAQVIVRPEAENAVRLVVGGLRADELDTPHILAAQAEVTRRAAERVRPYHVFLESVDLRTVQIVAPLALQQVAQRLILEQELLTAPRKLELSRQHAEQRRELAAGLVQEFDTLAPTLTKETLEERRLRAWERLLRAPSTSVSIQAAGGPALVEVSP
jgi:prohibitin 2